MSIHWPRRYHLLNSDRDLGSDFPLCSHLMLLNCGLDRILERNQEIQETHIQYSGVHTHTLHGWYAKIVVLSTHRSNAIQRSGKHDVLPAMWIQIKSWKWWFYQFAPWLKWCFSTRSKSHSNRSSVQQVGGIRDLAQVSQFAISNPHLVTSQTLLPTGAVRMVTWKWGKHNPAWAWRNTHLKVRWNWNPAWQEFVQFHHLTDHFLGTITSWCSHGWPWFQEDSECFGRGLCFLRP